MFNYATATKEELNAHVQARLEEKLATKRFSVCYILKGSYQRNYRSATYQTAQEVANSILTEYGDKVCSIYRICEDAHPTDKYFCTRLYPAK